MDTPSGRDKARANKVQAQKAGSKKRKTNLKTDEDDFRSFKMRTSNQDAIKSENRMSLGS